MEYKILSNPKFFAINETNTTTTVELYKNFKGMAPILQNSTTEKRSQKNDNNKRLQATNMTDDEKRKILIDQAERKLSQLFEKARTEIEEEETNKNEKKKRKRGDENNAIPTTKNSHNTKVYNIVTSALKAKKQCREQHYHCDYSPKFGKKCYIGLLALQDDTKLEIAILVVLEL